MPVLMRFGKKLGLLTTPARDAAKQWAEKTRQYEMGGHKLGDAAIAAARDVFHADFKVSFPEIISARSDDAAPTERA